MILKRPMFLNNPEWYYFDENAWKYVLTDKATEAAKESYKDFYEAEDKVLYG